MGTRVAMKRTAGGPCVLQGAEGNVSPIQKSRVQMEDFVDVEAEVKQKWIILLEEVFHFW